MRFLQSVRNRTFAGPAPDTKGDGWIKGDTNDC